MALGFHQNLTSCIFKWQVQQPKLSTAKIQKSLTGIKAEKLTFECILLHGSADVFHDITFWFDDDFPQRADHGGSDDFRAGPGVVEGGAKGPYHVRLLLASGQLRAHQVVGHVLKRTPHLDQGLVDVVNNLEIYNRCRNTLWSWFLPSLFACVLALQWKWACKETSKFRRYPTTHL